MGATGGGCEKECGSSVSAFIDMSNSLPTSGSIFLIFLTSWFASMVTKTVEKKCELSVNDDNLKVVLFQKKN